MTEYILFAEGFEDVRMKFNLQLRSDFIRLYTLGFSYEHICTELQITETEFLLISIDLNHRGLLPVRKNGILGNRGSINEE